MPLSSRSGTMKCVLLWTMSGTDNPADRYLPVSSATCNSLVVIIGPPKKWNLCSILSLEGRIFFVWNFLSAGFQKKSTFFLYETVFKRSQLFFIWDFLPAGFQKKSTFFNTRLFSKEVDFLREGSDTWGPILHTRGVWCYSGCGNDKHPWLDLPLIYVYILESIRL
mgnify:CR=1 FL=1